MRRENGQAVQHTFTRKHQFLLAAAAGALTVWAAIATSALLHRPAALEAKERELEENLAAIRSTQARLASAEKLVGELVGEVEGVHANLVTLADSSNSLAKEAPKGAPAKAQPDADQDDEIAELKAMRAQVDRLEESLAKLRSTYARAAQRTADNAGSRIEKVQAQISKLGINGKQLVESKVSPGVGGPFIPAYPGGEDSFAMGALIERMQQWNGVQAAMRKLPLAVPIRGQYDMNSGFGTRPDPLNHRTATHEGLDFGAPVGTPVYATGEGEVVFAGTKDGYGNIVEVSHGNGITTRYAHMSKIKAHPGQKVNRSTVIGLVGNTGRSTGAHLHYEVRLSDVPKDPIKFISVGGDAAKVR